MRGRVGQYLNLGGVWHLLVNPRLSVPSFRCSNVAQIDYEGLKKRFDLEYAVFDKDNTLTLPYEHTVPQVQQQGLDACVRVFGADKVFLFSNSAGSLDDHHFAEAGLLEKKLGIRVLRHKERKPGGGKDLALVTGGKPALVVGDRLFTDVVFANLNSCVSVLVDPIDETKDNSMVRFVRRVENGFLKRL